MDVSRSEKLPKFLVENQGQTQTILGEKIYLIGGVDDQMNLCVQILDNSSNQCTIPTVLGTKPKAYLVHSALLLNKDRILILLKDSTPDDCIWFLEVDTEFVQGQKRHLNSEVVAWSKGVKGGSPMPVVISGPSGVGKGTLISKLMEDFPMKFGFSVSHTTRAPRVNERDGAHYHFSERKVMEKAIEEGHFLEFASVHGNLYGTSIKAVEAVADAGKMFRVQSQLEGVQFNLFSFLLARLQWKSLRDAFVQGGLRLRIRCKSDCIMHKWRLSKQEFLACLITF